MRPTLPRLTAVVTATLATVAASLTVGAPAQASASYRIAFTASGVHARTGPSMDYSTVGATLDNGTSVAIACETNGRRVTNVYGENPYYWDRLTNGRWVPNAFIDTGVSGPTPGVPRCGYSPAAAVSWAKANVTARERFSGNDCAWYASHALWAGGLAMSSAWTEDPGSRPAINADAMMRTVAGAGHSLAKVSWKDATAGHSVPGDVIGYDWQGDGVIDHVAVATRLDSTKRPYVAQHSPRQADRLWSWSATQKKPISTAYPHAVAYRLHP